MTVLIKVDQAAHPAGVPGQAREDLATGVGITLTAVGGPFLAYQWSIVSKPIDILTSTEASSLLASPTANITTLSPIDVAGTYLVQIAVDSGNGLGAGTGDISRITFYAGPTLAVDPSALPRRGMAAFESTEHNVPDAIQPLGNTEGWSREWYRWFAAIVRSITLTLAATANAVASTLALRTSTGDLKGTTFITGPSAFAGATLTTNDATPTALLNIPFADDAALTGETHVVATTLGVGIFNISTFGFVATTTGGVLALLGAPVVVTSTTYVGPQPTVDIVYAAGVLTIRATGLAATPIKWVLGAVLVKQTSP